MSSEAQQDAVLGVLDREARPLQTGDLVRESGLPEKQVREALRDLVKADLAGEERGGFFVSLSDVTAGLVDAVPPIETIAREPAGREPVVVPEGDASRDRTEVVEGRALTVDNIFRAMVADPDGRALTVRAEVELSADGEGVLAVERVVKILRIELGE